MNIMKFDQIKTGFGKQKYMWNKRYERISDNRTKFEVEEEEEEACTAAMDSQDLFFRKIAVGRAYLPMMTTAAAIRYKQFENYNKMEPLESDEEDEDDDIFSDDILYQLNTTFGRYFDTVSKEATMIRDNCENALFAEIARTTRIEREAAETNRRHVEIRARYEQGELFKQVMKTHQNISELVNDRLTDDVIDEYANDVAIELIRDVIASNSDKIGREDEHFEQELQDIMVHLANTT